MEIPVAGLGTQTQISLPVTVVNGFSPGQVIWLSAAIHGDQIKGVEISRQVLEIISRQELDGTVIAVQYKMHPRQDAYGGIRNNFI